MDETDEITIATAIANMDAHTSNAKPELTSECQRRCNTIVGPQNGTGYS